MKQLYSPIISTLLLAATLLSASCTDDSTPSSTSAAPISFAAQVEGLETRNGQTGIMDNTTLTTTGFGVFAYGADGSLAKDDDDQVMFSNKSITYSAINPDLGSPEVHLHPSNWTYGSKLYDWDKNTIYSFLAYAPYVSGGAAGAGITEITANSLTSTTIDYEVAAQPSQSVDLLWGVKATTGIPWLNQTGETNDGLVLFTFHHALAAIGFHVQAIVDQDNQLSDLTDQSHVTGLLGYDCKVTLKSIMLYQAGDETKGFYTNGTLNLNNSNTANTPQWDERTGSTALTLGNGDIDAALLDQGDKSPDEMTNTGITEAANSQTVITKVGDKEQFFMLIPEAQKNYTAKIEYYITYNHPQGGYKRLDYTGANAGIATISNLPLTAGVKYYLNFVIGLKTLKLDVTAEDWTTGAPITLHTVVEHGTSANSSLAPRR